MIRVSLNELAVRVSRALQGMGLPTGVADDAAAIVAWHDVAGLDGLGQLRAAIPALRADPSSPRDLTLDNGERRMDAAGGSLLILGGSLVDWLTFASADAGQPGVLTNARDLGLIGGVAALAADRGVAATFRAYDGAVAYHAVSDGVAVQWACVPDSGAGPVANGGVQGWPDAELAAWPPAGAGHVLDPDGLAERRHTALTRGVPVDADAWSEIYELARRVLVDDRPT